MHWLLHWIEGGSFEDRGRGKRNFRLRYAPQMKTLNYFEVSEGGPEFTKYWEVLLNSCRSLDGQPSNRKNKPDWSGRTFWAPATIAYQEYPEEINYPALIPEGSLKTIFVNKYERSDKARKLCIKHHGAICAVCHLNFEARYGQHGAGFIHVHHVIPLRDIGKEYQVDPINDLIPVCPNCHAMLHRQRDRTLTISELKEILASNAT